MEKTGGRIWAIFAVAIAVLITSTCGGARQPTLQSGAPDVLVGAKGTPKTDLIQQRLDTGVIQGGDGKSVALVVDVLKELDALQAPANVEASVFSELKDELYRQLTAKGASKLVSKPPTGEKNRVDDLTLTDNGDGTFTLTWTYKNVGDYDQNGIVAIADITPLAEHFQETADGEGDSFRGWIDGNGDGIINIQDITPLAENFFSQVTSYGIVARDNPDNQGFREIERVSFEEGLAGEDGVLTYSWTMGSALRLFRVAPMDAEGRGGVVSNTVEWENHPPVGSLGANPVKGGTPLTVNFDTSESVDWDGEIVKQELDLDGDGTFDIERDGAIIASHTYRVSYVYYPVLRLTDEDGGVSETRVEIWVGGRGDWWTEGRDATRQGSSPFIGPQTPKLVWVFEGEGNFLAAGPVLGDDGTIYIGFNYANEAEPGFLYAVDSNGSLKWKRAFPYGGTYAAPSVGADGTIYIGSTDKYLYALRPDGGLLWRYLAHHSLNFGVAISPTGVISFADDGGRFGGVKSLLYSLNDTGVLEWTYELGEEYGSEIGIGHDGTIYVGIGDDGVSAVTGDGALLWTYPDATITDAPAIANDGTIYFRFGTLSLCALNPDGTLKWKFEDPAEQIDGTPAISADGMIIVTGQYFTYGLSPDGEVKWSYFSSSRTKPSDPVVDAQGNVYFGSDTYVISLNSDGTEKWKYKTADYVWARPAIGDDGTLYVADTWRHLYAFKD